MSGADAPFGSGRAFLSPFGAAAPPPPAVAFQSGGLATAAAAPAVASTPSSQSSSRREEESDLDEQLRLLLASMTLPEHRPATDSRSHLPTPPVALLATVQPPPRPLVAGVALAGTRALDLYGAVADGPARAAAPVVVASAVAPAPLIRNNEEPLSHQVEAMLAAVRLRTPENNGGANPNWNRSPGPPTAHDQPPAAAAAAPASSPPGPTVQLAPPPIAPAQPPTAVAAASICACFGRYWGDFDVASANGLPLAAALGYQCGQCHGVVRFVPSERYEPPVVVTAKSVLARFGGVTALVDYYAFCNRPSNVKLAAMLMCELPVVLPNMTLRLRCKIAIRVGQSNKISRSKVDWEVLAAVAPPVAPVKRICGWYHDIGVSVKVTHYMERMRRVVRSTVGPVSPPPNPPVLSDRDLWRFARAWECLEGCGLHPTGEDMKLWWGRNQTDILDCLVRCEEQPLSGCWHFPNTAKKYRAVMNARDSWFNIVRLEPTSAAAQAAGVDTAEFVRMQDLAAQHATRAHPGLPALRHPNRPTDRVRHHPVRCELFHDKEMHARCCRPSHLARGDTCSNTEDQGYREKFQKEFPNYLVAFENELDKLPAEDRWQARDKMLKHWDAHVDGYRERKRAKDAADCFALFHEHRSES